MTSIGICGASGCGKSLLVRQLAATNCAPSLLEGEVGTFPPKIIELIINKQNPVELFKWFVAEYVKRLALAKKLSEANMLCFVDGTIASIPAHKVLEKEGYHADLEKLYSHLGTDVDITVLLVLSDKKFKELIAIRGRAHEQNEDYMSRSMRVQNEFIRLLEGKKNVLVLQRDDYDFTKYEDIQVLNKKILAFANKLKVNGRNYRI